MNTLKNEQVQPALTATELCKRFGVQCRVVSDLFTAEEFSEPIAQEDLTMWMVTAPAGVFPAALVRVIPLAASEEESQALAVQYLMLAERAAGLGNYNSIAGRADVPSAPIPTPVYMAFIMDASFWPNDDKLMVYASDLVIEVDGTRYDQGELEPATFENTTAVVIVKGSVFEDHNHLHSVREHFESWVTGHNPDLINEGASA